MKWGANTVFINKYENRVVHLLAEASEAKPALLVKKRDRHGGDRLSRVAPDGCIRLTGIEKESQNRLTFSACGAGGI